MVDLSLPRAVLFDMDGTMVDTEPTWIAAQHLLVVEGNGIWHSFLESELVGLNLEDGATLLREATGITLSNQQIIGRLINFVERELRVKPIQWRPGILQLLHVLEDLQIPSVIVTSSYRPIAQAVVDSVADSLFTGIVAGDDVSNYKPHPEPYLKATEMLGLAPQQCLALEDSPIGAESALAAGVVTVAIPHQVPVPPQRKLSRIGSAEELDRPTLHRLMTGDVITSYRADT